MISKRQFDILVLLSENNGVMSQREISEKSDMSLGTVNKVMKELSDKEYVFEGNLTLQGAEALEPYRVKKAIFITAGFGARLVPITLNTPKPLVRVNGKRIIDSLLDAVIEAGIKEIYVIRGYLSEQFDQLLYKYPMIKFIENPAYNETNNISSAMCANYLFGNSYVLEGDLLLYNKNLISKYQYSSNYLGVPVERTDDWCFETKSNKVTNFKLGGYNCHHMFGVSYLSEEDGKKFSEHIKSVYYSPGGKERFWDQVILNYYLSDYDISIRECSFDDIVEIDTFNELKELDPIYDV